MKTRYLTAAAIVASTLVGVGLIAGASPADNHTEKKAGAPAAAGAYTIDPVHSSVVFKIKHMGVSNFYGRFNKVSGTFNWDAGKPEATSAEITIDATSIDSNDKKRDGHLSSPDFFNTKEFPSITFKSKSMKKAGEAWDLTGDLTLLGKKKEVTAKFTPIGDKTTDKGALAGFEVHMKINRSDFGMKYGIENGALGDEVHLYAGFEGGHK